MDYPIIEPDEKKMNHLVTGIQKKFGLDLLGIDVIIENGTGRYGVIDINAFPGAVTASFHSREVHWNVDDGNRRIPRESSQDGSECCRTPMGWKWMC